MDDNDCLICFEDLDSKDKAVLSCNHVIHYSCLQQWIKKRKNISQICPICNNDGEIINIIDAKPLFKEKETEINCIVATNYKRNILENTVFSCCNIL